MERDAEPLSDARQAERDVAEALEGCLEKLANRCAVMDAGRDHAAFPREGLCFLRVTGSQQRKILWPAWLVSRGLAANEDAKRSIVCYGSGWRLEVRLDELVPYDPSLTYKYKRLGGGLYAEAFVEAEARRSLGEDEDEQGAFSSLVAQNLEACRDPVLLGRLYAEHERRIEEIPSDGDLLAVRWNADDWWPARVRATEDESVELAYVGYEGDDAKETIELGGELWTADVRCLGDDREPTFDSKDAALLDGGDFGAMAVEADDDDEYRRYKTDSEEELYDGNGVQIARKKRKKGPAGSGGEKKAKKAPRRRRGEARPRPKKIHLASEIAIRRAQWSVGAKAPVVMAPKATVEAEPAVDDSIPRWKRALLAAAPPAPTRKPASPRPQDADEPVKHRSTLANKRGKAPRPSALELLGAIRAPTQSLGNASKASVATQNDGRNAATEAARDKARGVEAAMLRAGRGVQAPAPAPVPVPATGAAVDDFSVDEFDAGRRRPPASGSDLPTYQRPNASQPLPPGWTAKWSARKQMYYYTHKAKGLTRWTLPREEKEQAPKPPPVVVASSNDDALERARATLAALEGSLPPPPVAAAASRWDAPPPDDRGAAAQRYVEQQRRYEPPPPPVAGFAPMAGWQPRPQAPRPGEVVMEMSVPSQHVGLIVGKGGANLDRMRRLYGGVATRVGQENEPGSQLRRIAFTGTPPNVDKAQADVSGLLRQRGADAYAPPSGSQHAPPRAYAPAPPSGSQHAPPRAEDPRITAAKNAAAAYVPPPAAPAPWTNPLAAGGGADAVSQLLAEADWNTRPANGAFAAPPPNNFAPPGGYVPPAAYMPAPPVPPRGDPRDRGGHRPAGHSGPYRRN